MTEEVLTKLIEFIENASPKVWQLLIKQVYAENIAMIAWAIVLVVISIALYKLGIYGRKQSEEDSYSMWDMGAVFCYVGFGISALAAFGLLTSVVLHYANPEFYAIKFVLQMIP